MLVESETVVVVDAAMENFSALLFWSTKSIHLPPIGLTCAATHDSSMERERNSTRRLLTVSCRGLKIIVDIA